VWGGSSRVFGVSRRLLRVLVDDFRRSERSRGPNGPTTLGPPGSSLQRPHFEDLRKLAESGRIPRRWPNRLRVARTRVRAKVIGVAATEWTHHQQVRVCGISGSYMKAGQIQFCHPPAAHPCETFRITASGTLAHDQSACCLFFAHTHTHAHTHGDETSTCSPPSPPGPRDSATRFLKVAVLFVVSNRWRPVSCLGQLVKFFVLILVLVPVVIVDVLL